MINVEERWERGIPHSPRSIELYEKLADADFRLGNDMLGFKSGGDGDNGEHLMYLLDIVLESEKV